MAGVIAIAGATVVRVVVAHVHATLSRSSAHVGRDVVERRMRRDAGSENEFVLVSRPVSQHVDDPPLFDDELDNVPTLARDAMIHLGAPIA